MTANRRRPSLSSQSSIASLIDGANTTVDAKKLWGVALTIGLILLVANLLAYVIVEHAIFGGDSEYFEPDTPVRAYDGSEDAVRRINDAKLVHSESDSRGPSDPNEAELGMTDSIPLADLSDAEFQVYAGFILWATMVLTGLGTELLVWLMFLEGGWDQQKENQWKIAQFLFPLLAVTSLTLALSQNGLAILFTVVTCWKFGFPETILTIYSALYEKEHSLLQRIVDMMNGIGTTVHHSSASFIIAMLVTHVLPPSRDVVQPTLPLVIQHWFVLLKYYNIWLYVVLEVIGEVWFEWSFLSSLENLHNLHWTGGVGSSTMLFAHWMYFLAGGLSLFISSDSLDADHSLNDLKNLRCNHLEEMKKKKTIVLDDLESNTETTVEKSEVGSIENLKLVRRQSSVVSFNLDGDDDDIIAIKMEHAGAKKLSSSSMA